MTTEITRTSRVVHLHDGSHFVKWETLYKGWTFIEGLFGNTLMDPSRKIHFPFGMDPREFKDAQKYIDAR